MEVLAAVHVVCEIASLETWCLQMSPSSRGSRLHAAGRTCRWLGVTPRRRWPVCVLPRPAHTFPLPLSLTVSVLSLPRTPPRLWRSASSAAFPRPDSLSRALLFHTFFSLCPPLSLLPWLLPSPNEMGRQEDWWKIQGHMLLLPFIIALLSLSPPLKSLSLSSLQLTAAGGKSCWTSARYMPSCCPVCPLIVYLRSKSLGLDSLVNSGLTFPGVGKHSESHFEFCLGYRSLFCRI